MCILFPGLSRGQFLYSLKVLCTLLHFGAVSLNTPFIYLLCCIDYTTLARRVVCERGAGLQTIKCEWAMNVQIRTLLGPQTATHYLLDTCLQLASAWHLGNIIT